jgi:hypothetical protein
MTSKYLPYFPPPLLDDLINGRWLPVVGAGLSLNAKVPPGKAVPLWGELGKRIEADLNDFSSNGPLDAISAFEHEFGRPRLIERLSEILLLREALPGEAHRQFCSIPFDLVCTTNFDFLLERQYDLTPRYVYPVVDEEQLSLNVSRDGTLLLKLHGDVRHPSRLVVTEGDYDAFLSRYPLIATYLANLLITKTAVLIGYSLDDPDFRQVWQIVAQRLGRARRQSYAIAVGAKPADVARFARRGVTVINLPGSRDRYGEILAGAFEELGAHWRNKVLSVSTVTEEEPLRELLLPRDASTRLCFFALPLHRLPYYRDRVFPSVEALGLVPVTADDVISPGDSVSAKIDALMDRSVAIIVEVGSSWTTAELKLALSRIKDEAKENVHRTPRVIIIGSTDERLPERLNINRTLIHRVDLGRDQDDEFGGLIDALRGVVPIDQRRRQEAQRLLEAKEFRAAIIAAMSYMEATLRERLDKPNWERVNRPMSLRNLVRLAIDQQIIKPVNAGRIDEWMRIRNEAVHSNTNVTKQRAQEIVDGVLALLPE